MEQLRSWLKTITTLVVILGFLETILPESGGVKGFAKLVFGLVLMAAILQPILSLVNLEWALALSPGISDSSQTDWLATAERLQTRGAQPVLAAVDESAAGQLEALVLTVQGVEEADVVIQASMGQIETVRVEVRGDESVGSRVQKIAAQYLGISPNQVDVKVIAGG